MRVTRRTAMSVGGLAALSTVIPAAAKDNAKSNEKIVRQYIDEVWTGQNLDHFDDIVDADYQPGDPTDAPGRDALKARVTDENESYKRLIPDVVFTIETALASAERVIVRGYIKGNAANGKAINAIYFGEFLCVSGKIKSSWFAEDFTELADAL